MWSYYGTKRFMARYYPHPQYDTIIEPFAGAAAYSLYNDNWQRKVILRDLYEVVIRIWLYLQRAKPRDILQLPDMPPGSSIDDHEQLCDEERWLIAFCTSNGRATPGVTAQGQNAKGFNSWHRDRPLIASQLYKIKHWDIACGDYLSVQNQTATWFIDPPYQRGGIKYVCNYMNYPYLKQWVYERQGQIILCENTDADWIEWLEPLRQLNGQKWVTTEAYWYRSDFKQE